MAFLNPLTVLQLGSAALLVVAIAKIIGWFLREKGPDPFNSDSRKPLLPPVIDQKQRDSILKESFNHKKVPEDIDAIIIGSGIGGLTTAAILAKAGKRCLVLEQHDQAGGCCHTFIEKGYEFDVGIHYIGEMNRQTLTKTLCDQITDGQLQWEPLDDEYDVVCFGFDKDSRHYPVTHPVSKWKEILHQNFPEETAAIDKYVSTKESIYGASMYIGILKMIPLWLSRFILKIGAHNWVTNYWKYSTKSVQEYNDSLTENKELKALFCYNFGDYGSPPSRGPASMQFDLHSHFMKNGGAFPVGGASEIAFRIIPVIESAGGKVLVRARVNSILTDESGQAVGVRVKDTDIKAPIVISDAGVHMTFGRLLPQEVSEKSFFHKFLATIKPSMSCISVFLGLKCSNSDLKSFGVKKQNIWAFADSDVDKLWKDLENISREEAMDKDMPFIFMSFPSVKDPLWDVRYPGRSTVAVVTFAPYSWFAKWQDKPAMHRGDDYEELKKTLGQKIIDHVVSLYPEIEDKIDYVNIGTPVSNRYYIAWESGEIYGLSHDVYRMSPSIMAHLRPETDVPGLYLTGQDVMMAGFSGALFGGVLCAGSILQRNLFTDLTILHRRLKKSVQSLS